MRRLSQEQYLALEQHALGVEVEVKGDATDDLVEQGLLRRLFADGEWEYFDLTEGGHLALRIERRLRGVLP